MMQTHQLRRALKPAVRRIDLRELEIEVYFDVIDDLRAGFSIIGPFMVVCPDLRLAGEVLSLSPLIQSHRLRN